MSRCIPSSVSDSLSSPESVPLSTLKRILGSAIECEGKRKFHRSLSRSSQEMLDAVISLVRMGVYIREGKPTYRHWLAMSLAAARRSVMERYEYRGMPERFVYEAVITEQLKLAARVIGDSDAWEIEVPV